MNKKHYTDKLSLLIMLGSLLISLPQPEATTLKGDMRHYRPPSKQEALLAGLGLQGVKLCTEVPEVANREGEESTRRVLYLPSNPGELVMVLDILASHASPGAGGTPLLALARAGKDMAFPQLPPGYHDKDGVLVTVSDSIPSKGPSHKRIEVALKDWIQAHPDILTVLPTATWQAAWEGSVGLQFNMPEGPLHIYFPSRYSGFAPVADYRNASWTLSNGPRGAELLGYKLHSIQMLHALTMEGAPKFDAMWIFYDSGLQIPLSHPSRIRFFHGSHLREQNQSNDYAHHQTLRLGRRLNSSEERLAFYTRMWQYMKQCSNPSLMEQLNMLETEEDVPFIRDLEASEYLDEKLLPEHPFTFRRLSLMQAYASMSLPMSSGDRPSAHISIPNSKETIRWKRGVINVRGGADCPVPDGLWDGRFKLFPRDHAHMINIGDLHCNGGVSPFDRPDRFPDGLHCGFAKKENIWLLPLELSGLNHALCKLEKVAPLVQSVWEAPGRFYYEKTSEAYISSKPVPISSFTEPVEDHKLPTRNSIEPSKREDISSVSPPRPGTTMRYRPKMFEGLPLSTDHLYFIRLFEHGTRDNKEAEMWSYEVTLKHRAMKLSQDSLFDPVQDLEEAIRDSDLWKPYAPKCVVVQDGEIQHWYGKLKTYVDARWIGSKTRTKIKMSRIRNFRACEVAAHNTLHALQEVQHEPWLDDQVAWLVLNADLCEGEVEDKQVHMEQRGDLLKERTQNTCTLINRLTGAQFDSRMLKEKSIVIPKEGYAWKTEEVAVISEGRPDIRQTYQVYPVGTEHTQGESYSLQIKGVPLELIPRLGGGHKPPNSPKPEAISYYQKSWMEGNLPFVGLTIGGGIVAAYAIPNFTIAATAGIVCGVWHTYRAEEDLTQNEGKVAPKELKFMFSNSEADQALTVTITCKENEPVEVTLNQAERSQLSACTESIVCQHKLYLCAILEDAEGKVTIQVDAARTIHEAGWHCSNNKKEREAESILKKMTEKVVCRSTPKSNSRWNLLGRGNTEEAPKAKLVGYVLIGDITPVQKVFDRWQEANTNNPLHKLKEAIIGSLHITHPKVRHRETVRS